MLTEMPPPKSAKELQSFLSIMNYLSKYSLTTFKNCEFLRRLISVKSKWTLNKTYKELYDRTKTLIKKDACMKLCDEKEQLYLETDTSGVDLGV